MSSASSRPNMQALSSPMKPSSATATPYGNFSLLPPADLVSREGAISEAISEEVLANLQPFPGTSPTYEPSPTAIPPTPASAGEALTPSGSLQRTASMPAPMSLPTVRPAPRRHATSALLQGRSMRPPMLSFQSFNPGYRFSAPMSAPDVRPSTSAGFAPHGLHGSTMHIQQNRPITSAGLLTLSQDDRPTTPPTTVPPGLLASPIAIRGTPSGLTLTRPHSPSMFDLFAHRGMPSPAESEGPSPAPSEWSGVSSYSGDFDFTNLHASSMPNLPLPQTPLQIPAVPMSHYAAFSPTSSAGSATSPIHGMPPHSFASGFMFEGELAYDPCSLPPLEEPAFGVPDIPMTMAMPGAEVDFEHLMEDFTTPSASRADIPPDWSSAFAHIAIQDEQHQRSAASNAFPIHDIADSHHSMIPAEQGTSSSF
ncbi:hypothetical protein CALCODRAFT_29547 [Calocera cornea HHB12733]|uniref:Uncharacterized protein n=1 Tax=Calocera cornea HHB12733 TaxID=1353952 RepID=A0A165E406_9BASI|nr:hypothetical protein CALCODRAFT_29547 [Calocera cornea HHB12733]